MTDAEALIEVIKSLGYDEDKVGRQGMASRALKDNTYFQSSVARIKYALMVQEDGLLANPVEYTADDLNRIRDYYGKMRLGLDALVNVLDEEILLAENADYEQGNQ